MRNKLLILLIAVTLLGVTACDRFTRPEPEPTITEKISDYFDSDVQTALDSIKTDDVSSIMALYSDEYLNNGVVKADIQQAYLSYVDAGNVSPFSINHTIENEDSLKVNWSFSSAKEIPQTDYLIADGDSYLFIGNQTEPPPDALVTFFQTDLKAALDAMTSSDVNSIMAFYSEDYLNNGVVKTDIEQAYIEFMNAGNAGPFTVAFTLEDDSTMKVNWSFAPTKEIPQTDYLIADGDGYLFIGDQLEPPTEDKKVAIVEVLTATWCPNCPELEEEIENLKSTYGDRLSFVEYHDGDGLSGDFSDIQSWYNIYSAPTGVIQGTSKLVGSETNTLNQYAGIIEGITSQDAEITIKNFSYTLTGDQYDFQVELANPGSVPADNLYLRYMLIEETSASLNNAGHPCKNVMLEQSKIALTETDFSGTYTFNHTVLETMPDDTSIILFIQTMPDVHDDQTSIIHNVLESPLY